MEHDDLILELYVDDMMPLDAAVGLMARGYDLNALEGHQPMFDPYFND